MKKLKINEKITMRGMNNLYYEVEAWTKSKRKENSYNSIQTTEYHSVLYMRTYKDEIYKLPEFKAILEVNGKDIEDKLAIKLLEDFEKVIKEKKYF